MAPKGPSREEDPLKQLADKLRAKNGVEWRSSILQDQRVEFIRGKDLARYLRSHEEQLQPFVSKASKPEQQVKELGDLLLRRRFLIKADRMFKKPKPGRKRLVKWPKKLVPPPENPWSFQEEFFYAWTYDRPKSPWYYVLCGLAFLGITLCTMFPLAPRPIKLVALYVSMTLIIIIFSVLLIRGLVAMTTWILLGRSLWIFPHLLSEEKGIDEAFWPLYELDERAEEGKGSHWLVRTGMALTLGGLVWALHVYVPDKAGSVKDGAWQAHDAILDMLNLHGAGQQKLGSGNDVPGNFSKPGAAGSSGKGAGAAEAAAGAFGDDFAGGKGASAEL